MDHLLTLLFASFFGLFAIKPMPTEQKNLVLQNAQNVAITKISYSTTGGRGGNYVNLDITSMSILYVQAHNGVEKTIKEKTPRNLWQSLTRSINLKDLDKIKSNPGHALYDGTDVTITVEKGREKHSVVNGSEDAVNYKKIKAFTDILEVQLSRLDKKIR